MGLGVGFGFIPHLAALNDIGWASQRHAIGSQMVTEGLISVRVPQKPRQSRLPLQFTPPSRGSGVGGGRIIVGRLIRRRPIPPRNMTPTRPPDSGIRQTLRLNKCRDAMRLMDARLLLSFPFLSF